MKKLFAFLLITCSMAAGAQNITLTKADTAKSNTAIRALQSQYNSLPGLDTNTVAKVRDKKVVFLQDAAIPVLQGQLTALGITIGSQGNQIAALQSSVNSQVIAIQNTVKAQAAQIATLQAQTASQQMQLNSQSALIDKLTVQVAALQAWQANMKIANQ